MSYKIVEAVLDYGPRDRAQALVLIAIAEQAKHDGSSFPGLPTITRRARVTERQTGRILQRLKDAGWFTTQRNAAGESGKATLYQINLAKLGLSLDIQESNDKASSLDILEGGHSTFRPLSLDISGLSILKNREPSEPSLAGEEDEGKAGFSNATKRREKIEDGAHQRTV